VTERKPSATQDGCQEKICKVCGDKAAKQYIPKTKVKAKLKAGKGATVALISQVGDAKFSVPSKYKSYVTINKKTGRLTIKKSYLTKMARKNLSTKIPVSITVNGKTYKETVNVELPTPKVTVSVEKISGTTSYRYRFKYNVKNASKIKVRVKGMSQLDAECDQYLSSTKSNADSSYLNFKSETINKMGGKITFEITAYYGKYKSKKITISKKYLKNGKRN
jgi:RecG-like helicase